LIENQTGKKQLFCDRIVLKIGDFFQWCCCIIVFFDEKSLSDTTILVIALFGRTYKGRSSATKEILYIIDLPTASILSRFLIEEYDDTTTPLKEITDFQYNSSTKELLLSSLVLNQNEFQLRKYQLQDDGTLVVLSTLSIPLPLHYLYDKSIHFSLVSPSLACIVYAPLGVDGIQTAQTFKVDTGEKLPELTLKNVNACSLSKTNQLVVTSSDNKDKQSSQLQFYQIASNGWNCVRIVTLPEANLFFFLWKVF